MNSAKSTGLLNSVKQSPGLTDPFGRTIDYLRLAITDRCNLRCTYCMPADGIDLKPHSHILTFEELQRVVGIFSTLGVRKIRITGGEPFVRKGAMDFIENLNSINQIDSINVTTNAVFIDDFLNRLSAIKIDSLNISLDSLQKDIFYKITRRDDFERVWQNIQKAMQTDIAVKLNMVVMGGLNDNEIIDFAQLSKEYKIEVRFLEQMPFSGGSEIAGFVSAEEILQKLETAYPKLNEEYRLNSTARIFQVPGYAGKIGIIAGYSRTFCDSCTRIRITPQGELKTCLYDYSAVDLRAMLRNGKNDSEIQSAILSAVQNRAKDGFESQKRAKQIYSLSMAQIGG